MEGEEERKEIVLLGDSVLVRALCGAMFCLASLSGSIRLKCSVHFDVCFYPNICCPGVCKEF